MTTDPGLYYATVTTTLNVPDNCLVYYTLDGSTPTQSSSLYQGETFEFNLTTVLRARAYATDGSKPSDTMTATYFVNVYHTLPIVSLVADPDALWNAENGMLTVGDNVDKSGGIPFKNTVYRAVKESGETNPITAAGTIDTCRSVSQ